MQRYRCYLTTSHDKAGNWRLVEAPSPQLAAEAVLRMSLHPYRLLEVWDGSACVLKLEDNGGFRADAQGASGS